MLIKIMKRIFILSGLFALVAFSTACTSSNDKQEEAAVVEGETAGEEDSDFFAEENGETDATASELSEDTANADGTSTEDVTSSETGLEEFDDSGDDVMADLGEDPPVVDSSPGNNTDPLADGGVPVDEGAGVGELAPEETAGLDYSGGDTTADSSITDEAPVEKVLIEVKKIKDTPYQAAGQNINAVYIAREGDTLKSVATKLGLADSSVLKSVNTTLKNKLKVGSKVYYQSPQRPDDATRMLTYYEDMGLAPEIYVSQAGDNIRPVSKQLLGHEDSWKEVWATNLDVQSKNEIPEGTQLKYWRGTEGAALPPVAQAPPSPSEDGGNSLEAPPSQNMAGNTIPPPPPSDEGFPPPPPSDESLNEDFPPPPSTATVEPPAPPPPPPRLNTKSEDGFGMGDDPNQTMALAVGAVLILAALLLLIMIRKKRARRDVDFSTSTSTQIE